MKSQQRSHRPREIFLSHASSDRRIASRIAEMVRRHGVAVWYSRTHLRGAQQWHDEIGEALNRCDWFIVLVSKAAIKSRWVKHELVFALQSDRYEKRILPVQISACDPAQLSWTLKNFQIVDFTTGFIKGSRALLRTWGIKLREKK
jgi:hypothetical protein